MFMNENKSFDKKIGCHIKTLPEDKYRAGLFEEEISYRALSDRGGDDSVIGNGHVIPVTLSLQMHISDLPVFLQMK